MVSAGAPVSASLPAPTRCTASGEAPLVGDTASAAIGAVYTISVRNAGAGPTSAQAVSVVDTLPQGLTAASIAGMGWTCTLSPLGCTRSDPVSAGFQYPAIYLTVNVAKKALASVTNTVKVSGGGQSNTGNDSASDPTNIRKAH